MPKSSNLEVRPKPPRSKSGGFSGINMLWWPMFEDCYGVRLAHAPSFVMWA